MNPIQSARESAGRRVAAPTTSGLERRSLLKWSSAALVGALAFGGSIPTLSLEAALARSPGGAKSNMSGNAVDLGEGDIGVLNYAYALEQLEAAFYAQATKTPYQGMASDARDMLKHIRDQEVIHREFFKAALGKHAIPDLEVDFNKVNFGSRNSVLSTARTFEDLGVAAYNGAGHLLKTPEYLLLAGKIVSVEARHATAIRSLMAQHPSAVTVGSAANGQSQQSGNAPVNSKGLGEAKSPSQVLSAAGPFIVTKISAKHLG